MLLHVIRATMVTMCPGLQGSASPAVITVSHATDSDATLVTLDMPLIFSATVHQPHARQLFAIVLARCSCRNAMDLIAVLHVPVIFAVRVWPLAGLVCGNMAQTPDRDHVTTTITSISPSQDVTATLTGTITLVLVITRS
jgi:hypothetical protein